MRYLLDTHAVLWFLQGSDRLPEDVRDLIVDVNNDCLVSTASLWELTIKSSLGKLKLNDDISRIYQLLDQNQIIRLYIQPDHLENLASLETIHRDPFDRLIIAQLRSENLTILTCDRVFENYDVQTRW